MQSPNAGSTDRAAKPPGDTFTDFRLDALREHPSYVRHQITVPTAQFSRLIALGDFVFQEPIDITADGTILDGYARVKLARLKGRLTLSCRVHRLSELEATRYLLKKHLRLNGWHNFTRGQVALDLEPDLREQALANQRAGGQNKGSSKLTEAARVDVRAEMAEAADLSEGTIRKVKQLLGTAIPKLIEALRDGEVSIHRAHQWSQKTANEQRDALWRYRSDRDSRKIRVKPRLQRPSMLPTDPKAADLIRLLAAEQAGKIDPIRVASTKLPGRTIYVTEELVQAMGSQEELALI